jgi:CheY-like chemotaxis protein
MDRQPIDLTGRRILVVEDDYALATDMCNDLRNHGATVLGPAPTPHYAFNMLMGPRGVDGAVLDIRLYGADVFELAEHLKGLGVPIVFASGDVGHIPTSLQDAPVLLKPILNDQLIVAVDQLTRNNADKLAPTAAVPLAAAPPPERTLAQRFYQAIRRSMRQI